MTRCRLFAAAWRTLRALVFLLPLSLIAAAASAQARWPVLGPDGGDARAIAAVPGDSSHLYLGTASSWIYESQDGGGSWHRLAKIASTDDLIVDHILVDAGNSKAIFVAAWKLRQKGGGLYVSRDAGRTWAETLELKDQPVFAFAQAPSNSQIFVAGTLSGVYRSLDSGATWTLISPPGSTEIHEVESLAVDPVNPDIIYAGTWHLPWKTADGGKTLVSASLDHTIRLWTADAPAAGEAQAVLDADQRRRRIQRDKKREAEINAEPGVRVETGQLLGLTGKSGNAASTPPHVHFGISRPSTPDDWQTRRGQVSPYPYLQAWRNGEHITPELP